MHRKTSHASGRQQRRSFSFESLEPRTMMQRQPRLSRSRDHRSADRPRRHAVDRRDASSAAEDDQHRTVYAGPNPLDLWLRQAVAQRRRHDDRHRRCLRRSDADSRPARVRPEIRTLRSERDDRQGNRRRRQAAAGRQGLVGRNGVGRRMGPCHRSGREDPPLPGHRHQHRQSDVHGRFCPELFGRQRGLDELRRPGVRASPGTPVPGSMKTRPITTVASSRRPKGTGPVSFVASSGDVGCDRGVSLHIAQRAGRRRHGDHGLPEPHHRQQGHGRQRERDALRGFRAVELPTDVVRHGDGLEQQRRRIQRR